MTRPAGDISIILNPEIADLTIAGNLSLRFCRIVALNMLCFRVSGEVTQNPPEESSPLPGGRFYRISAHHKSPSDRQSEHPCESTHHWVVTT